MPPKMPKRVKTEKGGVINHMGTMREADAGSDHELIWSKNILR